MKRTMLFSLLIGILFPCLAFASGSSQQPDEIMDINDRFRNVPAVSSATDPMPMLYYASFGVAGIDECDMEEPPYAVTASIIRFKIEHSDMGMRLLDEQTLYMDGNFVAANDKIDYLNCYNQADLAGIQNDFTTHARVRYESGTGFMASPVYCGNFILVLNKSGLLMAIDSDFTGGINNYTEDVVINSIDLRAIEREEISFMSHALEYGSTPVVIGNYIYVAGLQSIFKIQISNFQVVNFHNFNELASASLEGIRTFFTPLVWDLNSNNDIYLTISTSRFPSLMPPSNIVYVLDQNLEIVYTENGSGLVNGSNPTVDYSGYIYYPATTFLRSSRETRSVLSDFDYGFINTPQGIQNFQGSILSDFSGNLIYSASTFDGSQYSLSTYSISRDYNYLNSNNDPIFETEVAELVFDHFLNTEPYLNNHGFICEDIDHDRSLTVSISSHLGNGVGWPPVEEIPFWYNVYDHETSDITLGFVVCEYQTSTHSSGSEIINDTATYGGLAPYKTNEYYVNATFGTETGGLMAWPHYMDVSQYGLSYSTKLEITQPVISNTSHSKFQRDVTNNCSYTWADNFKVAIGFIPQDTQIEKVFANGYARNATLDPETNLLTATFEKLLAHPNYTVGFRYTDNNGTHSASIGHINVPEMQPLVLSFVQDLVVDDGDVVNIDENNLCFNSITINSGGILNINGSGIYSETININNGAVLNINSGASISSYECYCKNEQNNTNPSEINLVSNGRLITTWLLLDEWDDVYTQIEGSNQNNVIVSDLYLGIGSVMEILESTGSGTTNATVTISRAVGDHIRGTILTSAVLTITNRLDIAYPISISVLNNGKLVASSTSTHSGATADINMFGSDSPLVIADGGELDLQNKGQLLMDGSTGYDPILDISGTLRLNNSSELLCRDGQIILEDDTSVFLSGRSLIEVTDNGELDIYDDVTITGHTPIDFANHLPGDRIVIKNGGALGVDPSNPSGFCHNLTVQSDTSERWEGIEFHAPEYQEQDYLYFENANISRVRTLNISERGESEVYVKFLNSQFEDCEYGLKLTRLTSVILDNTSFSECETGIFCYAVTDVSLLSTDPSADKAVFSKNEYGLIILSADEDDPETIYDYTFADNSEIGLWIEDSRFNIGGTFTQPDIYTEIGACSFTSNGTALNASLGSADESVITHSSFTDNNDDALFIAEMNLRINQNTISDNGRQGIWGYRGGFADVRANTVSNNGGTEILGSGSVFINMRQTEHEDRNIVTDTGFDPIIIPSIPDFWDPDEMDVYVIARSDLGREVDVTGNEFTPHPSIHPERYYPSVRDFIFDGRAFSAQELFDAGLAAYGYSVYTTAKNNFTNLVTSYPESNEAVASLIYFLYIASKTDKDYKAMRQELNALVSKDYPDLYKEKERVVTESFMYEKNYIEAIARLEEVIIEPDTRIDSVMALADQGYCYVQLAESGTRALPNKCTVKTKTIEEYLEYMKSLRMFLNGDAESSQAPAYVFALDANYPNPFNPTTTISYSIPKDDKVVLKVYNIKGQLVKTLVNDHLEAGKHKVVWNGDNQIGKNASSGIYLYRLESGGKSKAQKMLLLK